MEQEFWMVWNPQGQAPTHQHTNEGTARIEAERLAEKYPGRDFYLLVAVAKCQIQCPPKVWTKMECIPF